MQPIVCVDELPPEVLRKEELLKSMSAHSSAEMRGIGRDEQTNNRWRPKLILCTNDTPHYQDTSGAVRERAIIIECPNGPRPKQKQDKKLFTERLLPELGAFVATCIHRQRRRLMTFTLPLGSIAPRAGSWPVTL